MLRGSYEETAAVEFRLIREFRRCWSKAAITTDQRWYCDEKLSAHRQLVAAETILTTN